MRDFQRLMVSGIIPEQGDRYAEEMARGVGGGVVKADRPKRSSEEAT